MKKNVKNKLLSLFLSLSTILTMSGCNRKINCNIDDMHVHLYRSDVGFTKYSSSELDHLPSDYYRTDDIVYVTPYEFKYYEYLSKNDFLHIETNYDLLKRYFPKISDHIEYEYMYKELVSSENVKDEYNNIVDVKEKYEIRFAWTPIVSDEVLTGNQRTITYAYMGYKIFYDENRNEFDYELSGYYDSIDSLIQAGYTHIRINTFARQVDKNDVIITESLILDK